MAEKRMFSNKITQSDPFLSMPPSSQNLYWHLSMDADDDGFVNRPKAIMRMLGASEDDMNLLIAKNFVIPFNVKNQDSLTTMVCVIKHWFIHNNIRNDRKKETTYIQEKNSLTIGENGAYTFKKTSLQPSDNQVTGNGMHSVLECSVLECSIDNADGSQNATKEIDEKEFELFYKKYPKKKSKGQAKKTFFKVVKTRDLLNQILKDLENRKSCKDWLKDGGKYIPHPSTYLNAMGWLDEYSTEGKNEINTGITYT